MTSPAREIGMAVFLGMLCLTALLERLQFQLRASEASVWWASNGRDVVNAFALGTMSLGLSVIGFTGPIALCIAATLVILLSVIQGALDRYPFSSALSLGVSLLLGIAIMLYPKTVHGIFRSTLEKLFP